MSADVPNWFRKGRKFQVRNSTHTKTYTMQGYHFTSSPVPNSDNFWIDTAEGPSVELTVELLEANNGFKNIREAQLIEMYYSGEQRLIDKGWLEKELGKRQAEANNVGNGADERHWYKAQVHILQMVMQQLL